MAWKQTIFLYAKVANALDAQFRSEIIHDGPFEYAKTFLLIQTDWNEVEKIVIEDLDPPLLGAIVSMYVVVNSKAGVEFRPFAFYDSVYDEFGFMTADQAAVKLMLERTALLGESSPDARHGYDYVKAIEALRGLREMRELREMYTEQELAVSATD